MGLLASDMEVVMSERFTRLSDLVEFLRSDKGCPWDREQTIDSLKPHLIEEMYEAVEAIEDGDFERLREELGDVLFLILFTARIAEEEGRFSIEDVLGDSYDKMRSRHPHVFETGEEMAAGQVLDRWEQTKKKEKKEGESVLSGVPRSLPALIKAQRIQQRAASLGFDWDNIDDVFAKIREELGEFEEEYEKQNAERIKDELGDILFAVVNVSRFLGIRAEDALNGTIEKFKRRFARVEEEISRRGRMTLAEMDEIWERSKQKGQKGDRHYL
jgi:tetrapyrrole methylase family protein/MazG family protein